MTAQPKTLADTIRNAYQETLNVFRLNCADRAHDTARRNFLAAHHAHERAVATERRERIKASRTHDPAPVIAAHAEAVRLFAARETACDLFRVALGNLAPTT